MPMLYKQGAQKQKPALLAPPNVFLEDTFTRYFPISNGLISAARMQISQSLRASTASKPEKNSFTPTPTMRWRSFSKVYLRLRNWVDVTRGIWDLWWNWIHCYRQARRCFLLWKGYAHWYWRDWHVWFRLHHQIHYSGLWIGFLLRTATSWRRMRGFLVSLEIRRGPFYRLSSHFRLKYNIMIKSQRGDSFKGRIRICPCEFPSRILPNKVCWTPLNAPTQKIRLDGTARTYSDAWIMSMQYSSCISPLPKINVQCIRSEVRLTIPTFVPSWMSNNHSNGQQFPSRNPPNATWPPLICHPAAAISQKWCDRTPKR